MRVLIDTQRQTHRCCGHTHAQEYTHVPHEFCRHTLLNPLTTLAGASRGVVVERVYWYLAVLL